MGFGPTLDAALAEKAARTAADRAAHRAQVAKLIQKGLPKKIILQRCTTSAGMIDEVARELGVRLPTYAEWERQS